jgi:hypothetical protein
VPWRGPAACWDGREGRGERIYGFPTELRSDSQTVSSVQLYCMVGPTRGSRLSSQDRGRPNSPVQQPAVAVLVRCTAVATAVELSNSAAATTTLETLMPAILESRKRPARGLSKIFGSALGKLQDAARSVALLSRLPRYFTPAGGTSPTTPDTKTEPSCRQSIGSPTRARRDELRKECNKECRDAVFSE